MLEVKPIRVALGTLKECARLARGGLVRPVVEIDDRTIDESIRQEGEDVARRTVKVAVHAHESDPRNSVAHGRKRLAEPTLDEFDLVEASETVCQIAKYPLFRVVGKQTSLQK